MLKKLCVPVLIASAFVVSGCSSNPTSAQQQHNLQTLQNKTWVLTHIGVTDLKADPSLPNQPSIQFDEASKRVSGSDGCNRIMGSYSIQGEHMSLSQMARTRMLCSNSTTITQKYNEALNLVTGYQVYNKTLRLLDRHGNPVLQFSQSVQQR